MKLTTQLQLVLALRMGGDIPLQALYVWMTCAGTIFTLFHILGLKFFYTLSFQKCSFAFYLSLVVSRFLMRMLTFCLLLCSLVLIFVSLICLYFLIKICSIKYVLLAIFILSSKSIWLLLSSLYITPKYINFQHFQICSFLFSNVLFYFALNCFSFLLSHILSFLGLSVVRTFWQCFSFLQKVTQW